MRWVALAPLLAATGCNWIYGLDHTIAVDAPVLPPGPRTALVWGIATTDGMPTPPGIDPVLVYKPIGSESSRAQMPMIQVGDDLSLADAPYDLADGTFEIPYALRESPHRIVYTLPGESVPHEVQWALTGANLVVPRTTRFDAPTVPTASGYTITPTGLTQPLYAPALYTSGVFTYSNNGNVFEQTGSAVTFRFAQYAKTVIGPPGAPQLAKGDWVMLAEWISRTAQQSSVDAYAITKVDLQANTLAAPNPEPTWNEPATERTLSTLACTSDPPNCLPSVNGGAAVNRLHAVLGAGGTETASLSYGVSPSTELPGFIPAVAPPYIERPLIMPFLESTRLDSNLILADPSADLGLERVVAVRSSLSRDVNGATLTSSLQAITNKFESTGIQFAAPLAINATLGDTNLSGTADMVAFQASSSVQHLKFETEGGFKADDYVVTLYELTGTALAPIRIYHVIAPDVKIDGSLLVAGHQYAFGITARSGFPRADRGDYAKAAYPFASTTTFVRTIMVQ